MSDDAKLGKDMEGDEMRLETEEEDVEGHGALKGRALKGEMDDAADVEAHGALKGRALKGETEDSDDVEAHSALRAPKL
jgi:hypothetical protein